MKKDLAVRVGAIVMVIMVAFFSIIPDRVRAEGEDIPDGTVEDATDIDASDGDEAVTDGENPAEGETPDTDTEPPVTDEDGTEPPETETPEVPTTEETPTEGTESTEDTEQPSDQQPNEGVTPDDSNGSGDNQPDTAPGTGTPGTDTPDTNPDGMEDFESGKDPEDEYDDFKTDTVTPIEDLIDKYPLESKEEDFIIQGNTVTGYKGAGGYIKIPDGITTIGDSAFSGITSIVGVVFPESLQTIGSAAFNGCSGLEAISIPGTVTSVGSSAFANCTGLSGLSISASAGTIAEGEFYNCSSLIHVEVPEGISSLASGAFGNCSNLSSITLPSTLANLDLGAFSGDVNLASISVKSGSYSSYDGCVYTADGRQLLLCPQGKTGISFAPGTVSVASGAFEGCQYLLSASIPAATNTIETNAFRGSGIRSVTIPAGVNSIGSQSAWLPSVIYGYSGSTAEVWARDNNYVFESLNGSSNNGANNTEDPESIEDEDDDGSTTPGTNGNGNGNSGNNGNNGGTNTSTVRQASPSTSGTVAAITRSSNSHIKDSTPKTGVEDYGIFFLSGAILWIGGALFVYSRRLRLEGKR